MLKRIVISQRFCNDIERLEKLFALYAETSAAVVPSKPNKHKTGVQA